MPSQTTKAKSEILPFRARQDSVIALPYSIPLREPLDASLLKAINAMDWQARRAENLLASEWLVNQTARDSVNLTPILA